MAVSVSTALGSVGTATSHTVPTPAALDYATTTLLAVGSNGTTDISAQTPPTGWVSNSLGLMSGVNVGLGLYERDTFSYISNLLVPADQPSTSQSITTASATATGRNALSLTIAGGTIAAWTRGWRSNQAASTAQTQASSVVWTMPNLTPTSLNAAKVGDTLVVVMCGSAFDTLGTITAGNMTLSNITMVASQLGDATGTPAMSIWTADIGANQTKATVPTITVSNPAGATRSFGWYAYIIRPIVENNTEGAAGAPIRVTVMGDSITHGGCFGGNMLGETVADPLNQRYIDLLFGNQADAVGADLDFQGGATGGIRLQDVTGAGVAASTWYDGSYTNYAADRTRSVRVRNLSQGGWDSYNHVVGAHKPQIVANKLDSGISSDVLIICLGANDEKGINGAVNTAARFRDNLYELATVHDPAPYVILVKEWAWAFDYVNGSAFTRQSGQTHALFHTAIDDAAALITASGRTCIVVDTAVDAVTSGGSNESVQTDTTSYSTVPPKTAASGTTPDNIHPNATYQDLTWRATIQTALDQVSYFQAAPPGPTGTGLPSIPSIPTIPSIP